MEQKKNPEEDVSTRERLFCKYYLGESNFNATNAARSAGYDPKWAKMTAHRMLKKPHIQAYLSFLLRKVEKRLEITIEKKIELLWKTAQRCYGVSDEEAERIKNGEPLKIAFTFNPDGVIATIAEMNKMQGHYTLPKTSTDNEPDTQKLSDEIKKHEREC